MNSKLIALLVVTGLVAQTQSLAAENAYCSKESASERWLSDYRTMPMNQILMLIASKAQCDLLTDADVDALHSFHETRGCSRDTPLVSIFKASWMATMRLSSMSLFYWFGVEQKKTGPPIVPATIQLICPLILCR